MAISSTVWFYKDDVTFNLVGTAANVLGTKIQNFDFKKCIIRNCT